MKLKRMTYLAGAAALAVCSIPAHAVDIINTGPVPAQPSFYVYGGNTNGSSGVAGQFSLSAPTKITSIEFYGAALGNTNTGNIRANGNMPGTIIYTGSVANTDNSVNDWVGLTGLNWLLGAGSYWLTFESTDGGSAFREGVDFPNPLPKEAVESEGVFGPTGPGTGSNFAFRVTGSAVSATPEPATWTIMVIGFGMVGGMMRSRRFGPALRSSFG